MEQRTVTVKGSGRESLAPDLILVTCTLASKDKDYNALISAETEKSEELTEAIVKLGFDKSELKTSRFSISTDYESYQREDGAWERRFAGYSLSHGLSLAFDLDMKLLNHVVNALCSCKKADPAFDIVFSVKDRRAASDRLLRAAVKDAERKAYAIAEAAGVALGEIISVTCGGEGGSFDSPVLFAKTAGGTERLRGASDIDIAPEDIVEEASVAVVWEIK
ncbi:MAG: SIMPL domain-containing protein [Bacteroides sp.]|nr:SIMPL domain-containing protein [Bacteroides sp.]